MGKFTCVIDYGLGNLRSVSKALEFVGAKVKVSGKAKDIKAAEKIVLPGVGAFRRAMNNLENLNILPLIHKVVEQGRPFLGICLGLQVLFSESEEYGFCQGLDIIKGKVKKFDANVKIPHMGWNNIKVKNQKSKVKIFDDIETGAYFYFVHSYYVEPQEKDVIIATAEYGKEFVCAVNEANVWGVQFHPEKSTDAGLKVLKNFVNL